MSSTRKSAEIHSFLRRASRSLSAFSSLHPGSSLLGDTHHVQLLGQPGFNPGGSSQYSCWSCCWSVPQVCWRMEARAGDLVLLAREPLHEVAHLPLHAPGPPQAGGSNRIHGSQHWQQNTIQSSSFLWHSQYHHRNNRDSCLLCFQHWTRRSTDRNKQK